MLKNFKSRIYWFELNNYELTSLNKIFRSEKVIKADSIKKRKICLNAFNKYDEFQCCWYKKKGWCTKLIIKVCVTTYSHKNQNIKKVTSYRNVFIMDFYKIEQNFSINKTEQNL